MKSLPLFFSLLLSIACFGQQTFKSIDSLANTIGMEFVYGDSRFPIVVPFGYYGSTAVYDFAMTEKWSALFLFRKLKDKLVVSRESADNLLFNYEYSLVAYFKDKDGRLSKQVLPVHVSLGGMSLHYGSTNLSLSSFRYLDGRKESGPNISADYLSGCVPIVISGETVTQVLYFYEGRWLERTERFD